MIYSKKKSYSLFHCQISLIGMPLLGLVKLLGVRIKAPDEGAEHLDESGVIECVFQ